MEKKDFLSYRALAYEVRQLTSYVESLEQALHTAPSPQFSVTPKAPHSGGSALAASVVRYIELKELFAVQRDRSLAQAYAVERAIQSLEDPGERMVMRLRYLEGRSWTGVCSRMQREGYSERTAYRLHGSALLKLKDK